MISTHVLDTSRGQPASAISVTLEFKVGEGWQHVESNVTNTDGRIAFGATIRSGTYRIQFDLESYFRKNGTDFFFTTAPVIFQISDVNRKYHVPLLLNPFGYSTYRGS